MECHRDSRNHNSKDKDDATMAKPVLARISMTPGQEAVNSSPGTNHTARLLAPVKSVITTMTRRHRAERRAYPGSSLLASEFGWEFAGGWIKSC
jgi:hypothetical protein